MTISPDTFVADVATGSPSSVKVFQRYGIDFCCGGRQPLRTASEAAGVPLDRLIDDLEAAALVRDAGAVDWAVASLTELARHISETYHAPQAAELMRLEDLLARVERAHSETWPDLVLSLGRVVRTLAHELILHTDEEEQRLFPAIVSLENGGHIALHGRALDRFIEQLEDEHVSVGRLLDRLRSLTGAFVPPADACPTFRALYQGLEDLSATLKQHVHLENYVLFPRAAALGRVRADAEEA